MRRYGGRSDLALGMWIKLARAYSTFNRHANNSIRQFGLTQPQFGVLECLGHLGPQTIGQLTRKLLSTGGNMTVVIDNLEKEELVTRTNSREDRRATVVRLTPKGKHLFDQIFPQHAEHITKLASVLTEEEQQDLGRLLKKLGVTLQAE
jgi:MarR family transcriptional regulator, 2-MHQ and catechol-resistance regulon repressor